MKKLIELLNNRPIIAGLLVLFLALLFRINDIFILKIDELWGEIILSKSIGFALILLFLYLVKRDLSSIGIHAKVIKLSLMIGGIITLAVYTTSYTIEYLALWLSGANPLIEFAAIDPKQGVKGGMFFALWLIFGNIINSFMEEGLFRGLLIPQLLTKYSFWTANTIQSVLFGFWHLVWPIKSYLTDEANILNIIIMGFILFLGTAINGFIWGYMYYKTNSLWAPLIAHFLTNTILNLVHINSLDGLDAMMTIRVTIATILGLISMIIIKYISLNINSNFSKDKNINKVSDYHN